MLAFISSVIVCFILGLKSICTPVLLTIGVRPCPFGKRACLDIPLSLTSAGAGKSGPTLGRAVQTGETFCKENGVALDLERRRRR